MEVLHGGEGGDDSRGNDQGAKVTVVEVLHGGDGGAELVAQQRQH